MCDIVNGTCFGCEFGWTGNTCKQDNALFEIVFHQYQNSKKKFLIVKKNEMHLISFVFHNRMSSWPVWFRL